MYISFLSKLADVKKRTSLWIVVMFTS